jgi:23S rRNA pseudouridine2605 synthase
MTDNNLSVPLSVQTAEAGDPDSQEPVGQIQDGGGSASPGDAQAAEQPLLPANGSAKSASAADASLRFADVVTGEFDADEESAEAALPPKRVLAPQIETPKLHKVLAQAGMGSRLEMEQLIMEGRISVNNEPAHIGQRIQFGDQIKVNGKPIRFRIEPPPPRVIAYHKPAGEVVTHDDPQNRPTVFRKLPKVNQGKWQSVGRLDLNTEGLLLFTNSGELANKLMHPRFGLEREYAVRVLGALSKEEKQQLLEGIRLDDGVAQFGSIEEGGGEGANCWYRVTISEGRNREVRRMLESVGHAVSRLIRIRYGAMVLPRGLKRGAWMELDESDIRALMQVVDKRGAPGRGEAAGTGEGGPGGRRSESGKPGNGGRKRQRNGGPRGNGNVPRSADSPQNARSGQGQGQGRKDAGNRQGGDSQPDPMKTAFGYIGADSFMRQRQGPRRDGGGGGNSGGSGGQRRGGRGR